MLGQGISHGMQYKSKSEDLNNLNAGSGQCISPVDQTITEEGVAFLLLYFKILKCIPILLYINGVFKVGNQKWTFLCSSNY